MPLFYTQNELGEEKQQQKTVYDILCVNQSLGKLALGQRLKPSMKERINN